VREHPPSFFDFVKLFRRLKSCVGNQSAKIRPTSELTTDRKFSPSLAAQVGATFVNSGYNGGQD